MNIIFMIDTSGSMKGEKIESVKDSISNILPMLEDSGNDDIKLAIQFFSRDIKWPYDDKLIKIEDYNGINPNCSGMTSMGAAFISLTEFLNKIEEGDTYILLITDGAPTDDYEEGLYKLYQLEKFREAEKFALPIGDDVDINVIKEFTGSADNIYRVHNLDLLTEKWVNKVFSDKNINNLPTSDTTDSQSDDIWN